MSRGSAFCSQLDETGYDAIDDEKNKKYIAGDINLILKEVHDKMGYPAKDRTVDFIQGNFDVPNLKQKFQDYISKRSVCLELKPRFFKPPYIPLVRPKQPWKRLSLDLVGPKKRTPTGNNYFSTVVEERSRFAFAFAVNEAKTTSFISVYHNFSRSSVLHWRFIAIEEVYSKVRSSNPSWIVGTYAKRESLRTIPLVTSKVRG